MGTAVAQTGGGDVTFPIRRQAMGHPGGDLFVSVSRSAWSTEVVSIPTLLIATSVSYTIAAYDLIDRGQIPRSVT